jgi:Leucine-rich repeat (LRR) protein
MFIKKDLRKIPTILEEAVECWKDDDHHDDNNDNDDDAEMLVSTTKTLDDGKGHRDKKKNKRLKVQAPLSELRLGRRSQEFQGTVSVLCQPVYLSKLQQLQTLNLYDCGISSLIGIGVLKDCPMLHSLNVGRNPLQELPMELALVTTLKEVWLDDCQLHGPLPECLVQLPQLEVLKLPHNRITSLPQSMVQHMVHLKVLNLDGNPLGGTTSATGTGVTPTTTIAPFTGEPDDANLIPPPSLSFPHDWSGMKRLEELYMRQCHISDLPCRMPASLVVWHLSSNPLGPSLSKNNKDNHNHNAMTTTSLWSNVPRLKSLSLNSCQLTCLPPGLVQGLLVSNSSNSSSLQRLVLSHNPHLMPDSLPLEFLHVLRAHQEFQSGPEIVWQPNPQLESLLLPSSSSSSS